MSATWTHIHFNLTEVELQTIYAIEDELSKEGVTFDTGCWITPEGPREWHTDWSLEGPLTVEDIAKRLDEKGVSYTLVMVPKLEEDE